MPQKTVATQLLERVGVNAGKLLEPPIRNVAAETLSNFYYRILRTGLMRSECSGPTRCADGTE
jgi:ferritin-like protein